jgi:hypothetical protein
MMGSATSVFDTPPIPTGAVAPPVAGEPRRESGPAPDRGRQALIAVLAVLIVAVVGLGMWLLIADDDDGEPPATTPTNS